MPYASFSTTQAADSSASSNKEAGMKEDVLKVLNSVSRENFRNIAIIAHVDHGKTTLVDALLKHCGAETAGKSMDSNQLEKEKGITILSKCTGLTYKGYKINIVDTPGHQDFGGEVERIMSMVDGVALVVCAVEGPMTQTRFVLQKALKQRLKPIVILNKVDRGGARVKEIENELFELFCSLESDDSILDYPVYYASARDAWAIKNLSDPKKDMSCILDGIIEHIPPPKVEDSTEFKMLVSQIESNTYFGKMLIGRIQSGEVKVGDRLQSVDAQGKLVEMAKCMRLVRRYGFNQIEMQKAVAGDIISLAGFQETTVTHTLNVHGNSHVLPSIPIDPPMIGVNLNVNTSPLAGKESSKNTTTNIKDRLKKEAENDVSLIVRFEDKGSSKGYEIQGRGDLHLGVLFEKLRREGYEFSLTPPVVIFQKDKSGKVLEPIEKVSIEIGEQYSSLVIEKMNYRSASFVDCVNLEDKRQKLTFTCPTRSLLGLRSELMNETKGTAIIISEFFEYQPHKGPLKKSQRGALVAATDGVATPYGIKELEKHGVMFIKPGQKVYDGMIIGEHETEDDVDLNPTKEKKLTNIRTTTREEQVLLAPIREFSIEEAITYIRDDEIIEVTPENIRLRKVELNGAQRKVLRRQIKNARK
eukprot:CAMPEP_0176412666 /NCGR_PEP_ID=MMETSP0127-20121128/4270_1 /TAXON_ID=938130 /ORGANISM="Platyophrya macrostoma, Strain WH" /LENGTH=642 /DNA_ID=CAMNT_0017792361 /DNA_START=66 /DNA_END=1994 /DNA_ORIENTATION=+